MLVVVGDICSNLLNSTSPFIHAHVLSLGSNLGFDFDGIDLVWAAIEARITNLCCSLQRECGDDEKDVGNAVSRD